MSLALRDSLKHNYGDYLTWPEDVRYELIDGEAYMMSPAPDLVHQDVAGEIFFQAKLALRNKLCRPFMAPVDVRLPKKSEADEFIDTVVQPDVFVVCDPSKLDRQGVRGAPDWVVEVLSPSTASHDQIKKRAIYQKHGVKEYWLVHPIDRVLTIYLLEDQEFGKPNIVELTGQTEVISLSEITIYWDELVKRLPEEY
jgi:Uma2 family endonuclease